MILLVFFREHKNHNEETQMEYLLSIESCKELELSGGCRRIPCYRMTHSWSYTYGDNIITSSLSISALAAIFAVVDHHVYIRLVVVKHYAWLLSSLDSPGDDFLSNVG